MKRFSTRTLLWIVMLSAVLCATYRIGYLRGKADWGVWKWNQYGYSEYLNVKERTR